jgi:FMN phosphatase YigB (HAD superfamily)
MKHLLFDFNKVLLFPKHSIPVDLLMMLQHKLDPRKVESYQANIDFDYYFEWNSELLDWLTTIKQKHTDVSLHIYTNSTFSIKIANSQQKITPLFSSQYLAKEINQPKDAATSYQWLTQELSATRSQLFFTDDTATNVLAATQAGLKAHHYTSNEPLFAEIEMFLSGA